MTLKTNSIIHNKYLYYFLGIVLIFIIWLVGSILVNNDYVVPTISQTFTALIDLFKSGYTYIVLANTLFRLIVSLIICLVLAIILATFASLSIKFKYFITPLITLLKSLPIAVIIILILVMLKSELAVYYISGVVIFPILYEATLNGYDNVSKDITDEIKLLSNPNIRIYKDVFFPIATRHIITGLIQSIGLGLKVLVMAEFISQPSYSIGNEIKFYKETAASMDYVYAWSLILIFFVLVTEILVGKMKKIINK